MFCWCCSRANWYLARARKCLRLHRICRLTIRGSCAEICFHVETVLDRKWKPVAGRCDAGSRWCLYDVRKHRAPRVLRHHALWYDWTPRSGESHPGPRTGTGLASPHSPGRWTQGRTATARFREWPTASPITGMQPTGHSTNPSRHAPRQADCLNPPPDSINGASDNDTFASHSSRTHYLPQIVATLRVILASSSGDSPCRPCTASKVQFAA